jgi:hypothetical protein
MTTALLARVAGFDYFAMMGQAVVTISWVSQG